MVAERHSTLPLPASGEGVVSPRAFPRRAEKRAQMLMSVGLGVDRACLPEGDEGLRAPDRVSPRDETEGEASRCTAGRFHHAHPRADWPAAEWRPGGRVASGRRRRDVPPVVVSPRRRLSRDGGGPSAVGAEARRRARESPR